MDTFELRRQTLRSGLNVAALHGVEFGPLTSPVVLKSEGDVRYIDHASTEELRQKYRSYPTVDTAAICEVDIVSKDGRFTADLRPGSLDYVLASHVAEHVPDLVTWLIDIESILKPTGELRLVLPDKRYSGDYLRRSSSPAELLDAYLHRLSKPNTRQILDTALDVVDVIDARSIYQNTLNPDSLVRAHPPERALAIARDAMLRGHYLDVHCWVFSPESFAACLEVLVAAGLVNMACGQFFDSKYGDWEFFVFLRPETDRQKAVESWRQMRRQAAAAFQPGRPPPLPDPETDRLRRELGQVQAELAALRAAMAGSVLLRAAQLIPLPIRRVLRKTALVGWWLVTGQLPRRLRLRYGKPA